MKFDEFKTITPVSIPIDLEGVADEYEMNEAFEALANPSFTPLIIDGEEKIIFRRCVQCAYFSIVNHCPKCSNHPLMLPVDFMKMGYQMETVGRVCGRFAKGTCIERVAEKQNWCKDCLNFWDKEFDTSAAISNTPIIITTPTSKSKRIILPGMPTGAKLPEDEITEEHDMEEELEDVMDQLDTGCSLLVNIKHLMDFLADRGLKTVIEPQDRRELQDFSTAIEEYVNECGFKVSDFELEEAEKGEVMDPNTAFNERDRELLDNMAQRQSKMMD